LIYILYKEHVYYLFLYITTLEAKNRADNASSEVKDAEFYIGIEGEI